MRRITKIFVALAMMLSFVSVDVFAAEVDLIEITDTTVDTSGTGWYWKASELKLTITEDLTITGGTVNVDSYSYICGISFNCFDDNTDKITIYLDDANLTIDSDEYGLYSNVDLAIEGTGSISINSEYEAVCVGGSFIIDLPDGDFSVVTNSTGVYAWDDIDIKCKNMFIESSYCGILNWGILSLSISGVATITDSAGWSIYTETDINLSGSGTITTNGYIMATGELSISEYLTVNSLVSVLTNYYEVNDIDHDTCYYEYEETIYGDVVFTDSTYINVGDNYYYTNFSDIYLGTLSFAKGSTLTIADGANVDLSVYDPIDFTNANIIVEDGGSVYFGEDYENLYYTIIDSFSVADIYVGEDIVHSIEVSLENNDYMPVASEDGVPGEITYTYSTSEDGTYTSTVPTAAGTYYVKATVATNAETGYVTTTTSAITDFEILAVPSSSTDDGDGDTDVEDDADTNGEVDGVVDTGDTNNILLFSTLSAGALALILIDMKKRSRA